MRITRSDLDAIRIRVIKRKQPDEVCVMAELDRLLVVLDGARRVREACASGEQWKVHGALATLALVLEDYEHGS